MAAVSERVKTQFGWFEEFDANSPGDMGSWKCIECAAISQFSLPEKGKKVVWLIPDHAADCPVPLKERVSFQHLIYTYGPQATKDPVHRAIMKVFLSQKMEQEERQKAQERAIETGKGLPWTEVYKAHYTHIEGYWTCRKCNKKSGRDFLVLSHVATCPGNVPWSDLTYTYGPNEKPPIQEMRRTTLYKIEDDEKEEIDE